MRRSVLLCRMLCRMPSLTILRRLVELFVTGTRVRRYGATRPSDETGDERLGWGTANSWRSLIGRCTRLSALNE